MSVEPESSGGGGGVFVIETALGWPAAVSLAAKEGRRILTGWGRLGHPPESLRHLGDTLGETLGGTLRGEAPAALSDNRHTVHIAYAVKES